MAERKSGPPKPRQKIPVGSQARRALNCLPKADELFIANQTGMRVYGKIQSHRGTKSGRISQGGRKNHKRHPRCQIYIIWAADDYELIWKLLTEVEKPQYHIEDITSHRLLMNVHRHLDGRYQRAASIRTYQIGLIGQLKFLARCETSKAFSLATDAPTLSPATL